MNLEYHPLTILKYFNVTPSSCDLFYLKESNFGFHVDLVHRTSLDQILVPNGDFGFEDKENWTEQEFNAKVVHEREGKRPLVTGEPNITLRDGVGIINDISFTDNSSWIKCQKFRLGARVVQSIGGQVRIKEAISEAFVVQKPLVKSIKEQAYSNVSSFVQVDGPAIFGPTKSLPTLQAEPISSSTTGTFGNNINALNLGDCSINIEPISEYREAAWCRIQAATMCSSVQLDLAARRNDVQQTSKIEKSKDAKQPKKIRTYVRLRKRI
ncbi:hypothetical protein EZV62_006504 [Acer yangbiense]|uniref:Calmodulin binding protein-like N-terminal domain-containing protein n=1 Tax=Acer yangbiense TaxID=1000413 RepID=A0A5C7I917_9ROSI|nr:hypothetical protein EZV62_006504 [Acer yangbiense]